MRTVAAAIASAALLALNITSPAAQGWQMPPESERCPSKWGKDDQRDTANMMTAQSVAQAAKLIKTGEVFERVFSSTALPTGTPQTGDTFTNGRYPNIDFANGGNIKGMIAAADTYLKLANDKTRIVPGHGPVGDKAALLGQAAAGLAVSVVAALLLSRLLASLLYEITSSDPATYLTAGALVLVIGAVASARPAWRAATGDPLQALRRN